MSIAASVESCGGQGDAEFLLVPQVDAGLVADLDRYGEPGEDLVAGLDHRVLGVPGQVSVVEVGQVVVEDARLRRRPVTPFNTVW